VIRTLALDRSDRLLVLAVHPDDESVATGGLLQHALAVGAETVVVFFTDGENNPWAQRVNELRWAITATDRARFAARRRAEARRALGRLEVAEASTRFLAFPDQGTTDLVLHGNEVAMGTLTEVVRGFRPTVVVGPSLLDLHPDHSALAVMLQQVLEGLADTQPPRSHVRYLVHNPRLLARREGSLVLTLSAKQRARKRSAIACHQTQLVLRSTWLLSFAKREERFYLAESPVGLAEHPVRAAFRGARSLDLTLASRTLLRSFGPRTVCLVGGSSPDSVRLAVDLPDEGGAVEVRDLRTGMMLGVAEFFGKNGRGDLRVPVGFVPEDVRLFAKVERRFGFFDEAGWKELPLEHQGERATN
jgi:LmbE family N-acetylglucosaminyl deacetylase